MDKQDHVIYKHVKYMQSKSKPYRGAVWLKGKCLLTNPWNTAEEAARQVDKLIYRAKGPSAPLNFPLDEAARAALDAITLEQLLGSFREQGASFSRGASSYRGVSWDKCNKVWQAAVLKDGKQKSLYKGPSEEDAARAYDAAALRIFGPRAKLNFPGAITDDTHAKEPLAEVQTSSAATADLKTQAETKLPAPGGGGASAVILDLPPADATVEAPENSSDALAEAAHDNGAAEDFQTSKTVRQRSRATPSLLRSQQQQQKQQQPEQEQMQVPQTPGSTAHACAVSGACIDQHVCLSQPETFNLAVGTASEAPTSEVSTGHVPSSTCPAAAATGEAAEIGAAAATGAASASGCAVAPAASEAGSDAGWSSDWSDEEEPLPPGAEAMLGRICNIDSSSFGGGLHKRYPCMVSQLVEEAMLELPSDIDSDDLSELLEGDEHVMLSDDEQPPFNPQDCGYTSDPWEDLEGHSKHPAQVIGKMCQQQKQQLLGTGAAGDAFEDECMRDQDLQDRANSSKGGMGYAGIKSLTAGVAHEWMPEKDDLDNPWLSWEPTDVLEDEKEHQHLLQLYTGTGSASIGAAGQAGSSGRQRGCSSRSSGSDAKALAVGGFAEEVPLHEFKYTGWPQTDMCNALRLVAEDGSRDNLSSRARAHRTAYLLKRVCPFLPVEGLAGREKTMEGNYLPITAPTATAATSLVACKPHTTSSSTSSVPPPTGPPPICFKHVAHNSNGSIIQPVQLMDVSDYQQQYMATTSRLKRPCPGYVEGAEAATAAGAAAKLQTNGRNGSNSHSNSCSSGFGGPAAPGAASCNNPQTAPAFVSMGSIGALALQAEEEGILLPPPLAIPQTIPDLRSNTSSSNQSCKSTNNQSSNKSFSSSMEPLPIGATSFPSLAAAAKLACNSLHGLSTAGAADLALDLQQGHVHEPAKRVTFREAIKPVKELAAKHFASIEALQKSLLQKAPASYILTCQEQMHTGAPSVEATPWMEDDDGHDELMEEGCMLGLPAAMCCYPFKGYEAPPALPAGTRNRGVYGGIWSGDGFLGGGGSSSRGGGQQQQGQQWTRKAAVVQAAAAVSVGVNAVDGAGVKEVGYGVDTAAAMEVDEEPASGLWGLKGVVGAPAAAVDAVTQAAAEDGGDAGGAVRQSFTYRLPPFVQAVPLSAVSCDELDFMFQAAAAPGAALRRA